METVEQLTSKVIHHLTKIYKDVDLKAWPDLTQTESADSKKVHAEQISCLASQLLTRMRISHQYDILTPQKHSNLWNEQDIVLITYGDSIIEPSATVGDGMQRPPLQSLYHFLHKYCGHTVNHVHILPFFPYSSDDGFSIIDYSTVNQALGDWQDITHIANEFGLMTDLVVNHCSSRSAWFENFINGKDPGKNYFYTADENTDVSGITRPRTSDLLRKTTTADGDKYVWCTFSHDQVDFDFRNPEVLLSIIDIIRLYLDKGTRIFRLDAIAFLWKELGTNSINLPQTHEAVRLMRTLIEHASPNTIIITETNIPNRENLTYLGNANEAHAIYNFSLPPLLLNTLITGNCHYLKCWLMSMPPAQNGTFYFNFVASHDGIGLRPAEGLLSEDEIANLVDCMQKYGGKVSWRSGEEGKQKPYELNIALIDALQGDMSGPDEHQIQRFLCAHTIMLGLEGMPGLYIHSLLGTFNDNEKVTNTGHNRSINRHRWNYDSLTHELDNPNSLHHQVLTRMSQLIAIRKAQSAFHPNATQFTLQYGNEIFGFWRQSVDRKQCIFCLTNVTKKNQTVRLSDINLIGTDKWIDLISQTPISPEQESLVLAAYESVWISNKF